MRESADRAVGVDLGHRCRTILEERQVKNFPLGARGPWNRMWHATTAAFHASSSAASKGATSARMRLADSCRGDFHLGACAQPLSRVGLSNLGRFVAVFVMEVVYTDAVSSR